MSNQTEIIFYYSDGTSEGFKLPIPPQQMQSQVNLLIERPFIVFHLSDRTVFVCTSRLNKIEIKPSLDGIQGMGVFPNASQI